MHVYSVSIFFVMYAYKCTYMYIFIIMVFFIEYIKSVLFSVLRPGWYGEIVQWRYNVGPASQTVAQHLIYLI